MSKMFSLTINWPISILINQFSILIDQFLIEFGLLIKNLPILIENCPILIENCLILIVNQNHHLIGIQSHCQIWNHFLIGQ